MFPREHGAWSMLAQPALAALILFGTGPTWWMPIVTLVCMLAMFLLRQPLIVLARQRWVWKERKPESGLAWRWVAGLGLVLAAGGYLHLQAWPLPYLLAFGSGALALTAAAVYLTLRNEQRSIWLQVVSAAGLTAGAPAMALTATGGIPFAAWILWACSAVYCASGVLTVRALLEARIAAKRPAAATTPVFRAPAWISQWILIAMGAAALAWNTWVAAALFLIAALHIFRTLRQLGSPALLAKPLTRVGFEAMGGSLVYTALLIVALK
jgi:hypothetical protein